jgi:hypothetical protein
MTNKIFIAGAVLLAAAFVMLAADDITGKWVLEIVSRTGGPPVVGPTLALKADGAKLTGTITSAPRARRRPDGAPPTFTTEIFNGRVNGSNISFNVSDGLSDKVTMTYEGAVSGSEMTMRITLSAPGLPTQITDAIAKRE